MTPLPPPLGSGALTLWRIDDARFAGEWRLGIGARLFGGRWNAVGIAAVYASLDPATAILEVAVHKGFAALDAVPHVLTAATIVDPTAVRVVMPDTVPDAAWLNPRQTVDGLPQRYGSELLQRHGAVALPSTVSRHSWNLVMLASADIVLANVRQEPLVIDPRLHVASAPVSR